VPSEPNSSALSELSVKLECGTTGMAIPDASIALLLSPAGAQAMELRVQTGVDGTAIFRELPPGEGLLCCAHAPLTRVRVAAGGNSSVTLSTGKESVRIEVVDELDHSVEWATVLATASDGSDLSFVVGATDSNGILEVTCTQRRRGWFAQSADGSCSSIVYDHDLPAGAPVRLRLSRAAGWIAGRVMDQHDRAVSNADIVIRCANSVRFDASALAIPIEWPPLRVRTDAEGRFRCSGPPDASGHLSVHASGFASCESEFLLGEVLELRLEPTAFLAARVTEPDGHPISGARVFVRGPHSRRPLVDGRTDEEGRCDLTGLAPGEHTVEVVAKSGWRSQRNVRVESGLEYAIGFELHGGVVVEVEVVDADGRPPRGMLQAVLRGVAPLDPTPRAREIDASGRSRFDSTPPGDYILQLVGDDSRLRAAKRELRVGSARVAERFELPELPDRDSRLRGHCRSSDDTPIGEALLLLEGPDSTLIRRAFSEVDSGAFDFGGVVPGKYVLRVSAPGWVPLTLPEIVIQEAGALDIGRVVLLASARLSVRMASEVSGTHAEVCVERGGLSEVRSICVRSPLAPELDLEPGRYVVRLFGRGIAPDLRELEIAAGSFTHVELVPTPGLEVSLRIDIGSDRGAEHGVRWAVRDVQGVVLHHGRAQTDVFGLVVVTVSVAPGAYSVEAEIEGRANGNWEPFEVVEGGDTRVDVRIP
jgi:hypothetical protein